MPQVTMVLTIDPKIICVSWQTKAPILVSLSIIGFKLLSGQGFCDQVTVDLTF